MIQTLFGSSEQKPGLFERMKEAVSRTRDNLSERIEEAVGVADLDRVGHITLPDHGVVTKGLIRTLREQGIAIVWIEHIVHVLVQVVERLVCMDEGRVIADGAPGAVMADAAVIDTYLGSAVG